LLLAPALVFAASTIRMKMVKAESLEEEIILRAIYAPVYRIIRATGLLTGICTSLILGLRVKHHNSKQGSRNSHPLID